MTENFVSICAAPGPELKTTADYMDGVFTCQVRRDVLASRAHHLLPTTKLSLHNTIISEEHNFNSARPISPNFSQDSNSTYSRLKGSDRSLLRHCSVPSSTLLENNTNSCISDRFANTTPSLSFDSNCYAPNKINSCQVSRSSSYLGASPVHLSSANQVANFTSISSPIRSLSNSGGSKPRFLANRSLSSPEHPNAFNTSLSHVVQEVPTDAEETYACDEPRRKT